MTNKTAPRMRQSERRRLSTKKLIRACLELAAEHGMPAITFESIGQKAGYSRGLASQKFGSKNGLMEAVINHLHEQVAEARAEAQDEQMSGLEALQMFIRIHLNSLRKTQDNRAYFVLFCASISEMSDMRELFAASHERSKNELVQLFHRGKEDGSVRTDVNAEQGALLIGSQIIGISTQYLADPAIDLDQIEAEFIDMVARSYRA